MKAELKPLSGKYYGSIIGIILDDGTEAEIKVWIHGAKCEASQRELNSVGFKTTAEACAEGWICDTHFESKVGFDICTKIVDALNSNTARSPAITAATVRPLPSHRQERAQEKHAISGAESEHTPPTVSQVPEAIS